MSKKSTLTETPNNQSPSIAEEQRTKENDIDNNKEQTKGQSRDRNKDKNKQTLVLTDTRGAFVEKIRIDNLGVITLEFDNGKKVAIGEMDTSLEELRKLKKIPLFKVEIVGLKEAFSRAEKEEYR